MKKPIELTLPRALASAFRPERLIVFERLVRSEIALHRLLASSRRAASTHMAAIRQAQSREEANRLG